VNKLVAYLLENAFIDFAGELNIEMVRDFLRDDDSPQARTVLARVVQDGSANEMMVTLADCLKDYLRTGINEEMIREQITLYAES
jgi:hypothetical protein